MEHVNSQSIHLRSIALVCIALVVSLGICGCAARNQNDPLPSRPQEPVRPLPYQTETVRFENAGEGIHLAGTLSLPIGRGPHPAVILITGAGPQDRDETIAGHKPFLVLADYLTRRGFAVLRYDDRGVAGSTGNFATATMREFASDVQAAVKYAQSRPEVDSGKIGLAGHSEGGMVAPMAALELPGQIAFLILLASPGITGEEIFYLQDATQSRAQGTDEATIERNRSRKKQIFEVLKNEPDLAVAEKSLREVMNAMSMTPTERAEIASSGSSLDALINQQIRLLNNEATRFFLTYDPIPALKRTAVPVLAVTGENDLQVPPSENLPPVEAALSSGACPNYSVRELTGLNHLFQTSETGLLNDYAMIEETFAPSALQVIGDWLATVLHDAHTGSHP